mmetsp:Transcript_23538/g.44418  ORF Transcript_23538/g.44418 Transcript_23538/m.44418 type:complete len:200 (-) Transcript_23538:173-772(-)
MGQPYRFDWKGSLAPERKGAAATNWQLDWKASLIPVQPLEVRNTFVHFQEDEELISAATKSRRTASSPPDLRTPAEDNSVDEGIDTCMAGSEGIDTSMAGFAGQDMGVAASCLPQADGTSASVEHAAAAAHDLQNCRPCAYFRTKADGCQKGDACEFCHICTLDDVRARQTYYKRQARAQKRAVASKARAAQKTSLVDV